ncbi:MAG TPA: OB-fold nucleic acid binding domain-containing protein, partial [Bdellovibrionota bacterium]|nr:OB-fold nucleic acid binding domain-containing protein [Bdellovibrionota bacterium]
MRTPISELTEKSFVESSYLVKAKNQATAKNGKPYLNIILMDRTGEIESRVWDDAEELGALFEKGDVIQIKGHINLYQGKKQLIITDLEKVPPSQVKIEDFLPVSKRNIEEMFKEVLSHIQDIKDPWLKKLAQAIFSNPQLTEKFKRSPAAVGVHHVFVGGLLEHALSLCSLVKAIAPLYPILDEDLLISACLYHDIGKTEELSFQQSFEYTNEGKLLGHVVQGVLIVDKEISKIPNFPNQLKTSLHH